MHKHASTNRYYRLVWSHVHACWVAVAEGARGRGKSASRKRTALLIASALSGAALAAPPDLAGIAAPLPRALPAAPAPNALPSGAQVVAGQASITSAANQMTVNQGSDKAILNWQSFDIGAQAGVRFVQPNANAVALNRVLGNDPSRIYGQLSANGKVFLVNQSGVLFGASARVDVGGLIASSLALGDADFLAGRTSFGGAGNAGAVRNEGSIRSADGGYVALLGTSVANAGSIVAPNGSVALGAGEQIAVDLRGDGLITLRVERGAVAALSANSGLLQADGGRVELSAQGADALARASVNNSGVIQARGLVADGGSIRLAGDGDVHAGALDASSLQGKGGAVAVAGGFVALDGVIDAGGVRGGSVDVRAAGTLSAAAATGAAGRAGAGGAVSYHASTIIESNSASVDASGATDGGSIGVQGDASVLTSGSYSARGAQGKGGRIDVAGADLRLFGAQLDAGGNTQGGLVRIGGAFQGGAVRDDAPDLARFVTRWGQTAPLANATSTFVGEGTAISVGAGGAAGQGGTAVVWSDKQTTMLGSVDARGAGAAGTVEISSKDELRHVGLERIALGSGGRLLLDPKNITIGSSAGSWTYQAVLGKGVGANGTEVGSLEESDGFGFGVALNAAGDRLAVGAPFDDGAGAGPETGRERGAVHLFSFTDTNFGGATLQGTIGSGYSGGKNLNVNLPDGSWFGSAVALNANATRLAVGSPYEGSGAVHLYSFADGQFGAPALAQSIGFDYGTPNLDFAYPFGTSVALNAGGDRLAVGALYDAGANGTCSNCGAVYLFNNALASATFVKGIGAGYAVNMALPSDAQFGTAVAFDASGDRLAVSAYGVDGSRGAVYLFNNAYGATAHAATLGNGYSGGKNLNVSLASNDGFGSGLAFNGAGTRLAVGAMGAGGGVGNVHIIDFSDNQFSGAAISTTLGSGNTAGEGAAIVQEPGENFGFALAMNGAGDRLVVGSPLGDGDASDANAGYGAVRAFALMPAAATSQVFNATASANTTVNAGMLAAALDGGTSITLQANNDITLDAGNAIVVGGSSGNGALTLQAGRSVTLNSSITTGNANLTVVANETAANGVVNAQRDPGAATITIGAGTTVNAGSGQVSLTLANGAGKTNTASGAISVNGSLQGGAISVKNLGPSLNSNVVIGAAGSIAGNGLVEIVANASGSSFVNNAGAAGLNPGSGRYLVYSSDPNSTIEGVSGYAKHYGQAYSGAAPAYAASGNWFLYSASPVLYVNASAAGKVYDGSTALPALNYTPSGFIDGDTSAIITGALGVTGLTRNAGSYAINAGDLGTTLGYTLSFTGNTYTVSPRLLSATVGGVNKVYDGSLNASVSYGDDRIAGDLLSFSSNASFASKNVGAGKTVSVSGIALGGVDAGNYALASTTASTSADITPRALTASAVGLDRTYNGGTSANVVLNDDRVAGDVLALSAASAGFADKNAGAAKLVTVNGIALGGQDAGNYTLVSNTATTNAAINRLGLNVNAAGSDKVYDGGTAATVTLTGANSIGGDDLTLAGSAVFADKNAGSGKAIAVSGITLGGQDAANYTLVSTTAGASADIAKRSLTASASGVNKTYDGSLGASVTFSDDRVAGDVLAYSAGASFADKNVGSAKLVSVSGITLGGADAGNYTLAVATGATQADITRRALTVSATGAAKVYDGNTDASVTLGDNRVAGDVLALAAGGASFADKNAGSGKLVSVSGIGIDGLDADNYVLTSTSASASADITARTLHATASALDKVYDGTTAAQFGLNDDRVAGDVLALAATNASFADKNVGAGKAVTVSGLSLSGQDAGNYVLDATIGSTSAAITRRALNAVASAQNKTYDGTTAATATLGSDGVSGDLLVLNGGSASFADKNAGSAKLVNVGGITLGGQDAANYTLVSDSVQTTADIGQRRLVATAAGQNKTYDGSLAATVTFGDDRLGGDVLAYSASASFADKNVGSAKAIAVSGITLGGLDAGNYVLDATTASASADITPRTLAASASGVNKTYDGGLGASLVFSDDRVAGDLLAYSAGASFADKNAGSAKQVTVSGITLGGADAGNYTLAATSGTTQADITRLGLNVNAVGADKVYDGGTTATVTLTGANRVLGDDLRVDGVASFADKNAGSAKLVTVGGMTLGGADAANYVLASATASTSAAIGKRTLNATVSALDKVYDGGTAAQVGMLSDAVAGDALTVHAASASFADKNVGAAKAVSVSGLSLSGQDAGNYNLVASTGSTTAAITARTLAVSAQGVDKVYDGGVLASVVLGDDRVAGDLLAVAHSGAAFADKNAGAAKAVGVGGLALSGQDAGNYVLASTTAAASAAITPRTLALSARGVDKVYDGGLLASVVLDDDRLGGDQLAIARSASFADKNVGAAMAVTVNNLALSGLDAGNYVIAAPVLAASAAITPKALAAGVNGVATKVYDGNNRAQLAAGQVSLSGFAAGEGASVGALGATYDSANVLQASTVQAALPQAVVSAAAGTQLSNYLLPASVRGAGAITPKALTVVGLRANAKVYDGNTTATLASIGTLEGLLNGDSLQLGAPTTVRFDNRNAASGKTVTASGYSIANGAAGLASNYAVANSASAADGSITQATLTVKANDASRPAGLSNPAFGFSVSGLLGGDSPAILPEFALASSATPQAAPGSYAITVASPATLQNYKLAYVDGVLDVTGAAPELIRAIRATIAPALPVEVAGGAGVAKQEQRDSQHNSQRDLPRVDEVRAPGSAAPVAGPRVDGTVLTLSGGTEVLTRNGGIRTAE